jgi:hypothetical protein
LLALSKFVVVKTAFYNCAVAKGAKVLVPLLTIELQRVIAILLIIPTAQHIPWRDFQQRVSFHCTLSYSEKTNSVIKKLNAPLATASKFAPLSTTLRSKKKGRR